MRQMQITVTIDGTPIDPPYLELVAMSLKEVAAATGKPGKPVVVNDTRDRREVVFDRFRDPVQPGLGRKWRRPTKPVLFMETNNRRRHGINLLGAELPTFDQADAIATVWETSHDDTMLEIRLGR